MKTLTKLTVLVSVVILAGCAHRANYYSDSYGYGGHSQAYGYGHGYYGDYYGYPDYYYGDSYRYKYDKYHDKHKYKHKKKYRRHDHKHDRDDRHDADNKYRLNKDRRDRRRDRDIDSIADIDGRLWDGRRRRDRDNSEDNGRGDRERRQRDRGDHQFRKDRPRYNEWYTGRRDRNNANGGKRWETPVVRSSQSAPSIRYSDKSSSKGSGKLYQPGSENVIKGKPSFQSGRNRFYSIAR